MTLLRIALAVLMLATSAASASAARLTYDCEFVEYGQDNWVSPRVILTIADGETSAAALDGTIQEVHGAPIAVKFKRRSAKSVSFTWTVKQVPGRNNTTLTGTFHVVLNQQKLSATMSVDVHGYDNEPRGKGKCKIIK